MAFALLPFEVMQGLIRCVVVAGLISACHTDDTGTPDGETGDAGLTIKWSSRPEMWPAQVETGLTLTSARFACDNLRVIGDAGPGDMRTTAQDFLVYWDGSNAPESIKFEDAPPGLYSQIALLFDGHVITHSYQFKGTVVVNGNTEDFVIEDDNPLGVTVSLEKLVSPGATSTISIDIDFQHALDVVKWDQLPKSDGKLELETFNPDLAEFRKKLIEAFTTTAINVAREN